MRTDLLALILATLALAGMAAYIAHEHPSITDPALLAVAVIAAIATVVALRV
ncbi:hypothetical protein [Streptomyces axinellae]|uniref:Uncharacterized protein n=1 Tax=Streptomyces axinellae TaxID=552788 RepID=A0ABP6DDF8_9ACTN